MVTDRSAAEVAEHVARWITANGGRVAERSDQRLVGAFGSPLRYRLLGLLFTKQLPFRLDVSIDAGEDATHADVQLTSDEGRGVVARLDAAARAYREQHAEVLRQSEENWPSSCES